MSTTSETLYRLCCDHIHAMPGPVRCNQITGLYSSEEVAKKAAREYHGWVITETRDLCRWCAMDEDKAAKRKKRTKKT